MVASAFRATFLLTAAVIAAILTSACGGSSPSSPSEVPTAPYSQTDLVVGTGATATVGRLATVNYTGWFYNPSGADGKGAQFDSSFDPGRTPLSFVIGGGTVIAGFSQGVTGMKVGGKRRLVIPAALAYGSQGKDSIPPNATLVFDIELLTAG
jgi:FKBP-type peptidyl-prolyl cis-trans isomerase FkpA